MHCEGTTPNLDGHGAVTVWASYMRCSCILPVLRGGVRVLYGYCRGTAQTLSDFPDRPDRAPRGRHFRVLQGSRPPPSAMPRCAQSVPPKMPRLSASTCSSAPESARQCSSSVSRALAVRSAAARASGERASAMTRSGRPARRSLSCRTRPSSDSSATSGTSRGPARLGARIGGGEPRHADDVDPRKLEPPERRTETIFSRTHFCGGPCGSQPPPHGRPDPALLCQRGPDVSAAARGHAVVQPPSVAADMPPLRAHEGGFRRAGFTITPRRAPACLGCEEEEVGHRTGQESAPTAAASRRLAAPRGPPSASEAP